MKRLIPLAYLIAIATIAFAQSGNKISPADARALLAKDNTVLLLDVRTPEEFAAGHIKGAKLLPYDAITQQSAAALRHPKNATIIIYCRSGRRSAIAATTLAQLGYTHLFDLGGINNWPYDIIKGDK